MTPVGGAVDDSTDLVISGQVLRFGPIRFRGMAISFAWPLLLGYAVVGRSHISYAVMVVPLMVSVVLAVGCYRMGLVVGGNQLVVRRLGSPKSIAVESLESAGFAPTASPGLPSSLVLRTTGGDEVKVRGVSRTAKMLPLPGNRNDPGIHRINEFFEAAGVGVRVKG